MRRRVMSSLPQGYVPGISTEQAAAQAAAISSNAPISRADDIFKPVRHIEDMLKTKQILRDNIVRICDPASDFYQREKSRLEFELQAVQTQLEGLEANRVHGLERLARIDSEIERLEKDLAASEQKKQFEKLLGLAMNIQSMQQTLPELKQ